MVLILVNKRRSRSSLSSHKSTSISFSVYQTISHLSGLSKSRANVCPILSPSLIHNWRSTKSMRYHFWHRACRSSSNILYAPAENVLHQVKQPRKTQNDRTGKYHLGRYWGFPDASLVGDQTFTAQVVVPGSYCLTIPFLWFLGHMC